MCEDRLRERGRFFDVSIDAGIGLFVRHKTSIYLGKHYTQTEQK